VYAAIGVIGEHLSIRVLVRLRQTRVNKRCDRPVRNRDEVQLRVVARSREQRLEPIDQTILVGLAEIVGELLDVVAGVIEPDLRESRTVRPIAQRGRRDSPQTSAPMATRRHRNL
jgi:hypothetical protein